MHVSLCLLEEALTVAQQELRALDDEDEELLQILFEQRQGLINQAWAGREGCDHLLLSEALTALQDIQRSLNMLARSKARDLSDLLKDSRQESRRVNGYRKVTAYGDLPLYVSRIG